VSVEILKRLTYISLGAGVQSSALYVLSTRSELGVPKAEVAIFADTQDEPRYVYDYLETLRAWGEKHGGPRIDVVTAGSISEDTLARHKGQRTRFAAIPAFTMGSDGRSTILRRQCTREYKIEPIEKQVRTLLGLERGQRAKGKIQATALIGISADEASRMKPSRTPWVTNTYPLVDAWLKRKDCLEIMKQAGLPKPLKSACVFCPFHGDAYWLWLKQNYPAEFARAAAFDEGIRDMSKSGIKGQVFLHRSLTPLGRIDFEERRRLPLFDRDGFENECEGMCGV
jgi:hypothetical protein